MLRKQESGEMEITEDVGPKNCPLIFLPLSAQNASFFSFLDL